MIEADLTARQLRNIYQHNTQVITLVKDEDLRHTPVVVKKQKFTRVGAMGVYRKKCGSLSIMSAFTDDDADDGEPAMTTVEEINEWRQRRLDGRDFIVFFDNLEPMRLIETNETKKRKN